MFLSHDCFSIVQKTRPLFSSIYKIRKSKPGPVRCFFKKQTNKPKVQKEEVERHLKGIDDDRFSEYFFEYLFSLQVQKQGAKNFIEECKKFKKELSENHVINASRVDKAIPNKIDVLFKFEKPEDLDECYVTTDSTFNGGYSSASLKLTENETAMFSGNICLDIPKTGNVDRAGYANLSFPVKRLSFFRVQPYDLSPYTHLVLKIRGDGRTYMVLLHHLMKYKEIRHSIYCHQLFTRGGPYWQVAKIPLHHFSHSLNGRMYDLQAEDIPLSQIEKLSITATAYEGPFKLEIDYVGLEFKEFQKLMTPYERYRMK